MFVSEYNRISMLSNMGIQTDIDSLDAFDIEVFTVIAQEYAKIDQEQQEKRERSSRRGR